jgi:hypothetical protein
MRTAKLLKANPSRGGDAKPEISRGRDGSVASVDQESIGAEVPVMSATLFGRKWRQMIAALAAAVALAAGVHALAAGHGHSQAPGVMASTDRSSWS